MTKDLFFYNPLASFISRTLRRLGGLSTGVINHLFPKRLFPLPTVTVILEKNGKLLAIKRQDGLGKSLPGGIIRWGETVTKAAEREVKEETAFKASVKKLIGVYSHTPKRFGYSVINLAYEGKITGGKAKPSSEGRPLWVFPKELLDEKHFGTKKIVQDYLEKDFLSNQVVNTNTRLTPYIEKIKYISRKNLRDFISWCGRNLEITDPILDVGSGYRNNRPEIDPGNEHDLKTLDLNSKLNPDYVADAQKMNSLKDKSFGTVVCTELLEHIPYPQKVIAEIARILKPGGFLILTVPFWVPIHEKPLQPDYWRFTPRGLKFLLKPYFSKIKVEVRTHRLVPVIILCHAQKKKS